MVHTVDEKTLNCKTAYRRGIQKKQTNDKDRQEEKSFFD